MSAGHDGPEAAEYVLTSNGFYCRYSIINKYFHVYADHDYEITEGGPRSPINNCYGSITISYGG